jgi:hypothetical protein
LKNVVERLIVSGGTGPIAIDELPPEVQLEQRPQSEPEPATHSRVD